MQDTFFLKKSTINCKGKLLNLTDPIVMGIVNVTPDSFYDGKKNRSVNDLLQKAEKMLVAGATILDVGGQSTRPGAEKVSLSEEFDRVIPLIKALHAQFPETIISIDTFRSEVAKAAIENGASIVNDVSAGNIDPEMFSCVASLRVPYVLTHMQGTPATMQNNPKYKSVINDIITFFSEKINQLTALGVNDIVLDPGFGFGKNVSHNYSILKQLNELNIFELPILAGLSRKSMIQKVLDIGPENALNGTTVLNTIALMNGASILRVHDVREAMEAIRLIKTLDTRH